MKIGVGMITMGARELPKKFFDNTSEEIFVYTDEERKGPGYARNKVLANFDGYDHVFIMDDDTYPVRKGWEQYFITQAQENCVHFMALPEVFGGEYEANANQIGGEMVYWRSALGCFNYQSKLAMETIGGYNTEYVRYGYEDAARNRRAQRAGLTGWVDAWGFPIRGLCYIHSEDVFWENPTPNISHEDKLKYIEINTPIYHKEISSPQLFYPYKEEI